MIRKVAIFALLAGATLVVLASFRPDATKMGVRIISSSIEFKQESWEMLLKEAKEENKLIFVDLYATWCGPCKMMKFHTFTKKEVGEFYNEHFINVSLNGEINKGAELMEKYNLRAFPSLLFINGDDFQVNLGLNYNFFAHWPIDAFVFGRYRKQTVDIIDDNTFPNSGGEWMYVIPGINLNIAQNMAFRASIDLPVYRNLLGTQLTTSYRYTMAMFFNIPFKKNNEFVKTKFGEL